MGLMKITSHQWHHLVRVTRISLGSMLLDNIWSRKSAMHSSKVRPVASSCETQLGLATSNESHQQCSDRHQTNYPLLSIAIHDSVGARKMCWDCSVMKLLLTKPQKGVLRLPRFEMWLCNQLDWMWICSLIWLFVKRAMLWKENWLGE